MGKSQEEKISQRHMDLFGHGLRGAFKVSWIADELA